MTLPPLPLAQWPESLNDAQRQLQNPLNVHKVLAHHPALLQAWLPFRQHIVTGSTLDARQKELIILRTVYLTKTEYEWQQHVRRGRSLGISDDEMARVRHGAGAFMGETAVLLQAVDETVQQHAITPVTLDALAGFYGKHQILDLIFTIGTYVLMALVINTFEVPLEGED